MNDEFLYQIRPPVRKAFSMGLYQKLSALESEEPVTSGKKNSRMPIYIPQTRWAILAPLLVILGVMTFTLAFYAPARAKALEIIQVIAGFTVEERKESPLSTYNEEGASPLQSTPAVNDTLTTGGLAATLFEPTVQTEMILQNKPFEFGMPAWVPQDYTLNESTGISSSQNWMIFTWENPNSSEIELMVEREYTGYSIPVGENSSEEIDRNGSEALLIRGFWNGDHQWDSRLGVSLEWEQDGHHYHLNYTERGAAHHEIIPMTADQNVIIDMLKKMAESIQS
jgi:hypothetical protein